jgi:hypothetical protein
VIVGVHRGGEAELANIVDAGDPPARFLGSRQRRQEHSSEDCDDRNHHEELDESESDDLASERLEERGRVKKRFRFVTRVLRPCA